MTDQIPDPLSGQFVIPWATAVTRRLNALGDKAGARARNERNRHASALPYPFEVRWDGSLNDGEGGWKIYLPTEHLLSYNGVDVATSDFSGVSVIQDADENDTPWYSFDDIDTSADHVWLVITVTESGGSGVTVEAGFAADEGEEESGKKIINICVAEISYTEPEEEGSPAVVEAKQSLVGSLHLGGTGNESTMPTPFMVGTYRRDAGPGEEGDDQGKVTVAGIVNGVFYWDGELKTVDSIDVPAGQAAVYLNCTGTKSASGYSWTFSLGTSPASSEESDTVCKSFKLYDFDGGAVAMDYRDTFLAIASGTAEKIEPDGASLDFVPAAAEGEEPDGDEGKLEIKGYKAAAVGKVPYKSAGGIVWGGKTILRVDVTPSTTEVVVDFTYTDGSHTEIHVPHGNKGDPGRKGDDGDTPEITATRVGGVTNVYADGDLIATINDGATPTITASKSNGVTTIYVDGRAIAQVADGADGQATMPDKDVVTGVAFAITGGKLVATLTKENLKTGTVTKPTVNVCTVGELDVVVSGNYSSVTHQFVNVCKHVQVIGTPENAAAQTAFTATPLSGG
ncbi:MAG: hypothetical protein IKA69_01905 [Kiritimatiellae bacterium]|nr:hypothetical protein [Kiritimatiellia bacterium]